MCILEIIGVHAQDNLQDTSHFKTNFKSLK